ncbi:Transcriptional regulator, IclR family [Candidatus Nitrotoga sp. BS]|uniref:IclR family transcriptional regulator n=1 Tax=Candidatus Nitrotoga sp. BS TaxID=2890408 RepID=UPI001EF1B656|nr:IclR family transcriptional regulator [Candidatus Nitrotoga sp. BS]CAH1201407.1 Transcriptional regulator, IclR family [Candidatus Nitrotoga sp. BS]
MKKYKSQPVSSSIQVIDRMVTLLDALAAEGSTSLKVLAAETALHPSTAFRILNSMILHGLVRRDEAGAYLLGPHLLRLAAQARIDQDLRAIARPEMEWLRDQIGETVNLTVRQGDEVVYVERVSPQRMMRVEQVVGSRAPLHVTAVGKLILGEAGESVIDDYIHRTRLPAYTVNTHCNRKQLLADIQASLTRGYALDNEEAELGVACIGVLVRDASGAVVAGLSVSAPVERRKLDWVGLVQETAHRISAHMGYAG